jgi:beta-mannanase
VRQGRKTTGLCIEVAVATEQEEKMRYLVSLSRGAVAIALATAAVLALTISASSALAGTPRPAAPSGLTVTVTSDSRINLAWTDSATNERSYTVERSKTGVTFSKLKTGLAANSTSYSDRGLTASTTYYYRVKAVNRKGSSAYSNVAKATTQATLPSSAEGATLTSLTRSPKVALGSYNKGVPWDLTGIRNYDTAAGKKAAYASWHQSFAPTNEARLWAPAVKDLYNNGYGQVLTWNPADYRYGANQPAYSHDAVIRGDHDAYMKQYLTDLKNTGVPVKLRFAHEMNGDWMAWGDHGLNGNTPAKYKQMFQKAVKMSRDVGATNIQWVWCPNVSYGANAKNPMSAFYPGDAYVDWICLDGYNWAEVHGQTSVSFDTIYAKSYAEITAITDKPLMIEEYSSHETTQSSYTKAQFFDNLRTVVSQKYPRIKAMSIFNIQADGADWRLTSSTAANNAYKRLAADPYFSGSLG